MKTINSLFVILIATCFYLQNCGAEVKPSEILIVTNSNDNQSFNLGKEYATLRSIPISNVISLKTSNNFSVDRETFEKEIASPLKQELGSSASRKRIKVLVLIYGMPFKIDEISQPINKNELLTTITQFSADLQNEVKHHILKMQALERKVYPEKLEIFSHIEEISLTNLAPKLFALHSKLKTLPNVKDQSEVILEIERLALKLFGKKLYLTQPQHEAKKHLDEISKLEKRLLLSSDDIKNLTSLKLTELMSINKELSGTIGSINTLKILADRLIGNETSASIDSELSLLWLFPGGSPISNRLPNPFFIEHKNVNPVPSYPFLMVSRIDAPSPEITLKNIHLAIETEEKSFPESNFLIDSRGFGFERKDEFGVWDRELVALAKKSYGENISIDFDQSPDLAIGAKNISLYIGWYQLRNYEPTYKFIPGAIGYHIASEEAINIHDKTEKGWCKNLLEQGVVATAGAVEEPYLDSFPQPKYFIPLISSGNYHLIDAYYLSTKYVSWRQILFGDPLYNPFKNKKNEIDFTPPVAPSTSMKTAAEF